ncbi:MAG: bacterial/archaeal transporter family-2 protein [Clostridiales bacterium]|jgi:transporter family-2 protein|nr:bacterial/archaeal transporter family-2 protein [Clostridiales bacterium]
MLALFTGALLALMVYFNGQTAAETGAAFANLFFQGFGLLFFSIVLWFKSHSLPIKRLQLQFIVPGIMSALTVLLSNTVIGPLGIALMVGISLFGQVSASMIIDQFGLLGKAKQPVTKDQGIGFILIAAGLGLFLTA